MTTVNNFDPISLLDDSDKELFSEKSLNKLRNDLSYKLWDYLTIKLSPDLTEEQLKEVLSVVGYQQRANAIKKYIANFDEKVDKFIEEFKEEFRKES